jgi:5-(carboxyamino)imidazole ribonucleotide synthase
MLALAGYPLGLRCRILDTSVEAPAGHLAELVVGACDDPAVLEHFVAGLSMVTMEFENVPVATVRALARRVPVYPPPAALETAQDRLHEKTLFQRLGIPTPAWVPIDGQADVRPALERLGLPAVLKTRRLGYDGKGQLILRAPADAAMAWDQLGGVPLILEAFVPFEREVSVLAVRSRHGQTAFYPLVENVHRQGILRLSRAPAADLTSELQHRAQGYATHIMETLDYVGVLAIEFFQLHGELLANEMAPRVHNSGHWTIEGAETSQFENHLRAVLGLPLGSTVAVGHAAMLNLIGTLPDPEPILAVPGAHLHLYGKAPRPGRKVGHVTIQSQEPNVLETRLRQLERILIDGGRPDVEGGTDGVCRCPGLTAAPSPRDPSEA